MKPMTATIVGLLFGTLLSGPAAAIGDRQYQAIVALGDLNGVALHCHYLDQTHRMKKALVRVLPRRRALGQGFDDQTNLSFLRFIEERASCPDEADLAARVDSAIRELEQAFGKGDGTTAPADETNTTTGTAQ